MGYTARYMTWLYGTVHDTAILHRTSVGYIYTLTSGTCFDTFREHRNVTSSHGDRLDGHYTIEECKAACLEKTFDKCAFFDYFLDSGLDDDHDGDSRCWLHKSNDKLGEEKSTVPAVQYERMKCDTGKHNYMCTSICH